MTWPTPATAYTVTPWTDPATGIQWIYDASIPAWARYRVAGGGTALTSYVTQIESLADYPDTFPPDLSSVNHATFDTTPTGVPTTEGTASWNATDHTLNLQTEIADVVMQVGQELLVPVKNLTGGVLTNGTAVAITGSTGDRMSVEKAIASNAAHAVSTIGLVTHEVANGDDGYVNILGRVRELTTNGYSGDEGSPLYLSAATAGLLTSTKPTNPNWVVRVGWLEKKAGSGAGRIHVACERLSVDEAEVVGATDAATASKVVRRDAQGGAAFTGLTLTDAVFSSNGTGDFTIASSGSGTITINSGTGLTLSGGAITISADLVFSATDYTFGTGAAAAFWTALGGLGTITAPTVTPTVSGYTETVTAIGSVTTSHTIDISASTLQSVQLTGNACTFTMPTAAAGKSFLLYVQQVASSTLGTATFTGVDWGIAGTYAVTATVGKCDLISFVSVPATGGGYKWIGSYQKGFTF